jgi:hypothetical protein
MDKKVKYFSKGLVHGHYWGGGKGCYKAEKLTADTKEELISKATEMLESGALDSGMGYESLIGALLDITQVTTITVDGDLYHNEKSEMEFIGDLTVEEIDFLTEVYLFSN